MAVIDSEGEREYCYLTYRYRAVMEACCLDVDMAALCDGDSTLIGDRGMTLSGGQRQRVSLAPVSYTHLTLPTIYSV